MNAAHDAGAIPSRVSPTPARIVVALVVAIAAISSAALLVRLSRSGPVTISFWRLTYATLALAPFAIWRARAEWRSFCRPDVALALTNGAVLALHFATWIASLAPASPFATTVTASAVLVTLHPVLVALGTPLLLRERVPKGAWLGMAGAFVGGAIIAIGDASHGTHRLVGDGLAFAGACFAAGYFLIGRRMRARWSLLAYATPVYATAALTLALIAWGTGESLAVTDLREHALFIGLAIGPMLLGHTVLNWVLGHAPAWVVSTTVLAEPIGSTMLVWAVIGERPGITAVAGGAVVLAGVAFVTARANREAGPRAPSS